MSPKRQRKQLFALIHDEIITKMFSNVNKHMINEQPTSSITKTFANVFYLYDEIVKMDKGNNLFSCINS